MDSIDYSVVIRTIGKASKKYEKLLVSIENLNPRPKEVIVVLPSGYSLPSQKLGWERFVFSVEGMVEKRLFGMMSCKTKYALFCDDDVEFESDFVSKLYYPMKQYNCAFAAGPLYEFLPPRGINTIINWISGSASPTLFHKKNYCTVLNTSGYSFNRHLRTNQVYYSQSLPWTCFFADISCMKKVELDKELAWLDKLSYAAMDDLTMFYKAYLLGLKTCVIPEASYIHNDAKTSSQGNSELVYYALSYNRIIFWHRFLYKRKKSVISKLWSIICIRYNIAARLIYCGVVDFRSRSKSKTFRNSKKGFHDALKFIKTDEYKLLPEFEKIDG